MMGFLLYLVDVVCSWECVFVYIESVMEDVQVEFFFIVELEWYVLMMMFLVFFMMFGEILMWFVQ